MPVAGQDDLEGSEELAAAEEEAVIDEDGITEGMTPLAAEDTGEIGEPDADLGAGWGETIGEGQEALPTFKATAIEDTTTVRPVTPEIDVSGRSRTSPSRSRVSGRSTASSPNTASAPRSARVPPKPPSG